MSEFIYGDEVVGINWPYDGPHDDDHTTQAAVAIERLVRYLNNATGPGHSESALPYAATAYRVISNLSSAMVGLEQLLPQLATFLEHQAKDPTLYDDRRDERSFPASRTAREAGDRLRDARGAALMLTERLRQASSYAVHLGNEDRVAEGGES